MNLNKEELRHYSRHILLDEIGVEGQKKLKKAKVLVIGAGGLGCPAAVYLGAAGIGHLGIIDFDEVDISNLHRQIIYQTKDVGKNKAQILKERILANNPHISIKVYKERFGIENAAKLCEEYDLILDGCDNFGCRYLSNDATFFAGKPLIFGAIHKFQGQASVFNLDDGPCYRCLFPEPPDANSIPNCAEAGVLGVLPGIIGSIQATEAIKIILGTTESLKERFLTFDALKMTFSEFKLSKNPSCPLCSDKAKTKQLKEEILLCPSQTLAENSKFEIEAKELFYLMKKDKPPLLIDVREEYEREICNIHNSRHIPLNSFKDVYAKLPNEHIIIYCHHGMRSLNAVKLARNNGLSNCFSLSGGISQWSEEIEPDMQKY